MVPWLRLRAFFLVVCSLHVFIFSTAANNKRKSRKEQDDGVFSKPREMEKLRWAAFKKTINGLDFSDEAADPKVVIPLKHRLLKIGRVMLATRRKHEEQEEEWWRLMKRGGLGSAGGGAELSILSSFGALASQQHLHLSGGGETFLGREHGPADAKLAANTEVVKITIGAPAGPTGTGAAPGTATTVGSAGSELQVGGHQLSATMTAEEFVRSITSRIRLFKGGTAQVGGQKAPSVDDGGAPTAVQMKSENQKGDALGIRNLLQLLAPLASFDGGGLSGGLAGAAAPPAAMGGRGAGAAASVLVFGVGGAPAAAAAASGTNAIVLGAPLVDHLLDDVQNAALGLMREKQANLINALATTASTQAGGGVASRSTTSIDARRASRGGGNANADADADELEHDAEADVLAPEEVSEVDQAHIVTYRDVRAVRDRQMAEENARKEAAELDALDEEGDDEVDERSFFYEDVAPDTRAERHQDEGSCAGGNHHTGRSEDTAPLPGAESSTLTYKEVKDRYGVVHLDASGQIYVPPKNAKAYRKYRKSQSRLQLSVVPQEVVTSVANSALHEQLVARARVEHALHKQLQNKAAKNKAAVLMLPPEKEEVTAASGEQSGSSEVELREAEERRRAEDLADIVVEQIQQLLKLKRKKQKEQADAANASPQGPESTKSAVEPAQQTEERPRLTTVLDLHFPVHQNAPHTDTAQEGRGGQQHPRHDDHNSAFISSTTTAPHQQPLQQEVKFYVHSFPLVMRPESAWHHRANTRHAFLTDESGQVVLEKRLPGLSSKEADLAQFLQDIFKPPQPVTTVKLSANVVVELGGGGLLEGHGAAAEPGAATGQSKTSGEDPVPEEDEEDAQKSPSSTATVLKESERNHRRNTMEPASSFTPATPKGKSTAHLTQSKLPVLADELLSRMTKASEKLRGEPSTITILGVVQGDFPHQSKLAAAGPHSESCSSRIHVRGWVSQQAPAATSEDQTSAANLTHYYFDAATKTVLDGRYRVEISDWQVPNCFRTVKLYPLLLDPGQMSGGARGPLHVSIELFETEAPAAEQGPIATASPSPASPSTSASTTGSPSEMFSYFFGPRGGRDGTSADSAQMEQDQEVGVAPPPHADHFELDADSELASSSARYSNSSHDHVDASSASAYGFSLSLLWMAASVRYDISDDTWLVLVKAPFYRHLPRGRAGVDDAFFPRYFDMRATARATTASADAGVVTTIHRRIPINWSVRFPDRGFAKLHARNLTVAHPWDDLRVQSGGGRAAAVDVEKQVLLEQTVDQILRDGGLALPKRFLPVPAGAGIKPTSLVGRAGAAASGAAKGKRTKEPRRPARRKRKKKKPTGQLLSVSEREIERKYRKRRTIPPGTKTGAEFFHYLGYWRRYRRISGKVFGYLHAQYARATGRGAAFSLQPDPSFFRTVGRYFKLRKSEHWGDVLARVAMRPGRSKLPLFQKHEKSSETEAPTCRSLSFCPAAAPPADASLDEKGALQYKRKVEETNIGGVYSRTRQGQQPQSVLGVVLADAVAVVDQDEVEEQRHQVDHARPVFSDDEGAFSASEFREFLAFEIDDNVELAHEDDASSTATPSTSAVDAVMDDEEQGEEDRPPAVPRSRRQAKIEALLDDLENNRLDHLRDPAEAFDVVSAEWEADRALFSTEEDLRGRAPPAFAPEDDADMIDPRYGAELRLEGFYNHDLSTVEIPGPLSTVTLQAQAEGAPAAKSGGSTSRSKEPLQQQEAGPATNPPPARDPLLQRRRHSELPAAAPSASSSGTVTVTRSRSPQVENKRELEQYAERQRQLREIIREKNALKHDHINRRKNYKHLQQEVLHVNSPYWDGLAEQVREHFLVTWTAYKVHAWGSDEWCPVTRQGTNSTFGGIGMQILDVLSALIIFDLPDELEVARRFVAQLDFSQASKEVEVSVFELMIRAVGGLLSAYAMLEDMDRRARARGSTTSREQEVPAADPRPSHHPRNIKTRNNSTAEQVLLPPRPHDVFLQKAEQLVQQIIDVFRTPSSLPFSRVRIGSGLAVVDEEQPTVLSEVATMQLELRYLSHATKNQTYALIADSISHQLHFDVAGDLNGGYTFWQVNTNKLMPTQFSNAAKTPVRVLASSRYSLGGQGDSYYEYLLKQFLQDGTDLWSLQVWKKMLGAILDEETGLVTRKNEKQNYYIVEREILNNTIVNNQMAHLACFFPGLLALHLEYVKDVGNGADVDGDAPAGAGEKSFSSGRTTKASKVYRDREFLHTIKESTMQNCFDFYRLSPTGLAPEAIVLPLSEGVEEEEEEASRLLIPPGLGYSLLRPETVESLYYLDYFEMRKIENERDGASRTSEAHQAEPDEAALLLPEDSATARARQRKELHPLRFKQMGHFIWEALREQAFLPGLGFCTVPDVTQFPNVARSCPMHTFVLGETLVYLYMLFRDHSTGPLLNLNEWVFNTEAHPLPRMEAEDARWEDARSADRSSSVDRTQPRRDREEL